MQNCAVHAGKPRSNAKPIVSFSDELEEDEGASASFSLAKTTNERWDACAATFVSLVQLGDGHVQ